MSDYLFHALFFFVGTFVGGYIIADSLDPAENMTKRELTEACEYMALKSQAGLEFVDQCVELGWHPNGREEK